MTNNNELNNEIEEYGPDILTLTDDDGVEHEFEVIDTADLDEEHYVAVVPVLDENNIDEEQELIILRVQPDENGEEFLVTIDDETEFNNVSSLFMDRLSEDYDIV